MNRAFSASVKSKNSMKKILPLVSACLALSGGFASAVSLMLDFGNPDPTATGNNINAGPDASGIYLTLSPGHALGTVPAGHTSWNTITTSSPRTDLVYGDGSEATGITLTLGQEASNGSGTISYSTGISSLALTGSGGGTSGRQALLHPAVDGNYGISIYGDTRANSTAVGRDAFFGGGTSGTASVAGTGTAVGLRVDGLAAGEYRVYVMARNTNSNDTGDRSMNIYATNGASSGTFDFSSLFHAQQANTTYLTGDYTGQHAQFAEGENFVGIDVTIGDGESIFLAVDGANINLEARGFLNMVQIVPIPEPSTALLGAFGFLALLRRRR